MKGREKEIQELKKALLKANEEIERLSKVKSDFVSIMSHELRTPLTAIKESVSLVVDGTAGPINENQKEFLNMTKNNIDRFTKLIVNILDFSKLDSGAIAMHKKKTNINELIKGVYAEVKDSVEEKGLGFRLDLSDAIKPSWFDPDRVTQVLKNLISNAVKFNKEKGSIKIGSTNGNADGKDFIKVSVEDTGIGISKEDHPKLFEHFNPLDATMTRSYSGVGLGLAISKSIIMLHGGKIWVESKKGVGSKFIFTLPI